MNSFSKFAQRAAEWVGSPWSFIIGVALILVWAGTGSYFNYSDTWQLVVNTGSSIITFLMVFLIQSTQNRDARVIHMKLDELIRALGAARTELVQMEKLTDQELEKIRTQFEEERDRAMKQLESIELSRKTRQKTV